MRRTIILGWICGAWVVGCTSSGPEPEAGDGCATDGCDDGGASTGDPTDVTGGDGGADETGVMAGGGLPCDVERVLVEHCMPCHDDPPAYGAPMALRDYDDLQVPATSDLSRPVHELVGDRIDDPDKPMPPITAMPDGDKQILRDWIAAGAPEGTDPACDDLPDPSGPDVGPDALPCDVSYTFTAHAGDLATQFHVPETGADNLYQCFSFRSPLTEPTQITAWAPIIDDERVVHHWILYRTPTPQPDGALGPCDMPSDATFVAGWAPGGTNFELPEDVGLEMGGPDDSYILQMHYHNAAQYPDAFDASGVAFCTADEPRPQTAGIVTLGAVNIDIPAGAEDHAVEGTCPSWVTNYLPQPVHMIASFPHMHELGRSIRTDILRGGVGGPIESVVDVPNFDFENQSFYPHDPEIVLQPGDALRTTCTYDNPYDFDVGFGEATEDEMCFNFVMAYPVEVLGENRQCGLL